MTTQSTLVNTVDDREMSTQSYGCSCAVIL